MVGWLGHFEISPVDPQGVSTYWKLGFVLPNCRLESAIDTDYVAMVPFADPRLTAITEHQPPAKSVVTGFRDRYGNSVYPSALLFRDDSPSSIVSVPALIAFRNLVALSHITRAWAFTLTQHQSIGPLWSDYFDISPVRPAKDGRHLVTITQAMTAIDDATPFVGCTTPLLPDPSQVVFRPDRQLLTQLLRMWRRRFESGHTSQWATLTVTRSLEMFFAAAAVPSENHGTLYDYGISVGLWVSAFEVVSRARSEDSSFRTVFDLLGEHPWSEPKLRTRRYRVRWRGRLSANLSQRLYKQLYDARNQFLHGNPVAEKDLHAFQRADGPILIGLAPLLLRVALLASLNRLGIGPLATEPTSLLEDRIVQALLTAA